MTTKVALKNTAHPAAKTKITSRPSIPHKTIKPAEISPAYASVWDAISNTPEEAENLRTRSALMQQLTVIIKKNKWTQSEAAVQCGVTQPRINDLLQGRISKFSIDALVNLASHVGQRVTLKLSPA
jgi:predicted XRE-type DNA-binding protein